MNKVARACIPIPNALAKDFVEQIRSVIPSVRTRGARWMPR